MLGIGRRRRSAYLVTVAEKDREARVWDMTAGTVRYRLPTTGDVNRGPVYNHSSSRLVVLGIGGEVEIYDTKDYSPTFKLPHHDTRAWSASFSPDDRFLAVAYGGGEVFVWDLEKPALVLNTSTLDVYWCKYLKNNRLVILTSSREPEERQEKASDFVFDCEIQI